MSDDTLFQARQNRLLAAVRVLQAGFAVLAILLDPDKPGLRDDLTYYVLLGYLVASAGIFLLARYWRDGYGRTFLPAFTLDFVVFTVVLYLTYGATSPFFLFFVFIVLSATLRWGWRGAAGTTVLVMAVFIPIGLAIYPQETGHGIDIARFVMRVGNMLALGGVLVAFGRHEARVERDMLRVFGPRLRPVASENPPIEACLEHAVTVFGLKRGCFIWGDPEEPQLTVSELGPDGFSERPLPIRGDQAPATLEGIDAPFVFDPAVTKGYYLAEGPQTRLIARPLLENPILREFAPGRALVLPIKASDFLGWVILADPPYVEREALFLGATVAAQISVAVEAWRSLMVWRDAAAADARVRLSQDLHDGVLQFLTGTALQLQALARELGPDQAAQRDRIIRLQDDLQAEQRQLRELLHAMGPRANRPTARVDLVEELDRLAAVLRRQWNVEVYVELDASYRRLAARLGFELVQIVREAVSNAARHGQAREIRIRGDRAGGRVMLTITDDGAGMPMTGDFDMADLERLGIGPRSLRARVNQLGGVLLVSSTTGGLCLRIALPHEEPEAVS